MPVRMKQTERLVGPPNPYKDQDAYFKMTVKQQQENSKNKFPQKGENPDEGTKETLPSTMVSEEKPQEEGKFQLVETKPTVEINFSTNDDSSLVSNLTMKTGSLPSSPAKNTVVPKINTSHTKTLPSGKCCAGRFCTSEGIVLIPNNICKICNQMVHMSCTVANNVLKCKRCYAISQELQSPSVSSQSNSIFFQHPTVPEKQVDQPCQNQDSLPNLPTQQSTISKNLSTTLTNSAGAEQKVTSPQEGSLTVQTPSPGQLSNDSTMTHKASNSIILHQSSPSSQTKSSPATTTLESSQLLLPQVETEGQQQQQQQQQQQKQQQQQQQQPKPQSKPKPKLQQPEGQPPSQPQGQPQGQIEGQPQPQPPQHQHDTMPLRSLVTHERL